MQIALGSAFCGVSGCKYYDQDVTVYVDAEEFGEYWMDDAGEAEECGHVVSGYYSWTDQDYADALSEYVHGY